jgi:stress-induced morphogen
MTQTTKARWERMQTDETRKVADLLRTKFPKVDAYRYNSASIRVRVIDPRFEGKSTAQRDRMVEPLLKQLPPDTQRDIINLLTLTPDEPSKSLKAQFANSEFEDPSPSLL